MATEDLKHVQVKEIIRSEIRQLPETRWIQNLRRPSYHLRQPIPILIEREGDVVAANYDDLDLIGKGEDVKSAISDLCGKIVACYDGARESADRNGDSLTQEVTFLRQIIVEIQPELVSSQLWKEVKQFYRDRLEVIPDVQKGYIKQGQEYVEVIIIVSGHSVTLIEQLSKIDLEINRKFHSLCFYTEYKRSPAYLHLDDFEQFFLNLSPPATNCYECLSIEELDRISSTCQKRKHTKTSKTGHTSRSLTFNSLKIVVTTPTGL